MLTFLFWNVARQSNAQFLVELAMQYKPDFLLLAECRFSISDLLQRLNQTHASYHYAPSIYERIVTFVHFSPSLIKTLFEGPNLLIRHLGLPGREEILLAAVHLPSQFHEDLASLNMECEEIAKTVREYETKQGHERTILIGDLNLNPFEPAVAGAAGFHAVMSKRVAGRGARIVHGRRYPFFYNPMWNHFGDERPPAGTYYYRGSGHLSYFWNVFDQVLVRPDLLKYLPERPVEIITTTLMRSLLRGNELPDRTKISDHLPILFTMNA